MNGWLDFNIAKMCSINIPKNIRFSLPIFVFKNVQGWMPARLWRITENWVWRFGVLIFSHLTSNGMHAHPVVVIFAAKNDPFFSEFFLLNDEELCTNQDFFDGQVTWTLPKTRQQKHLKIGRAPKGKTCLPTTSFQGLYVSVFFSEFSGGSDGRLCWWLFCWILEIARKNWIT